MRRVLGLILVGLGVAGLLLAPLLRFYAAPRLVKTPLDQFSVTVSEANNASYLDLGALTVQSGRTLVATRTVRGDVPEGNSERGVFDVFVNVIDPAKPGSPEKQLVSVSTDRVAFDRRTSEAINCCDEAVDDEAVKHAGIEYKFPFGTEKKTYRYFDTAVRAASDMEFVEEDEIEGLTVYKFEQRIEPTEVGNPSVPGSLIGSDEPMVQVQRMYSNTRTVWVEPASGVIVRGQEQQISTLREGGEDVLTITDADLRFTDETVANQAQAARDANDQAALLTTTGPLVASLVGLGLVGVGALLLRGDTRREGDVGEAQRAARPVPAR